MWCHADEDDETVAYIGSKNDDVEDTEPGWKEGRSILVGDDSWATRHQEREVADGGERRASGRRLEEMVKSGARY